jgi:hypothetical protein
MRAESEDVEQGMSVRVSIRPVGRTSKTFSKGIALLINLKSQVITLHLIYI